MATKTAKKAPSPVGLDLRGAQERAAEIWKQARKRADRYLPEIQGKPLAQLRTRIERTARDLEKARDRALKDARGRFSTLLEGVEKTAADVVKPFVARLDIASKSDVDRLRKRVTELEKRLTKTHAAASAA